MLRVILSSLLLFFALLVQAQSGPQKIDVRILVDISGEVRSVMPGAEHLDAVGLLLEQLPQGSKAGVWTYGKYVNHLISYGQIDDSWRRQSRLGLSTIRPVASERQLNSVLKKASFDSGRIAAGKSPVMVVLAAGGNMLSGANTTAKAQQWLQTEGIEYLRQSGYVIHTVTLGESVDPELALLAEETGGFAFSASTAADIYRTAMQLANIINPLNYVPLDGNELTLDGDISRLTLVALRLDEQVTLISPTGQQYNRSNPLGGNWTAGKGYDVFHLASPETGVWRLTGIEAQYSRAYIRSAFEIEFEQLAPVQIAGTNIIVTLNTSGDFENLSDTSEALLHVRGSDDYTQSFLPVDSASNTLTTEINGIVAGRSSFTAEFNAFSFVRAIDKLTSAEEVVGISVRSWLEQGKTHYRVSVTPEKASLDLDASSIVATISGAGEDWKVKAVAMGDEGRWEFDVADDGVSERLRVDLDVNAVTASGRQLNFKAKPLLIELPARDVTVSIVDRGVIAQNEVVKAGTTSNKIQTEASQSKFSSLPLDESLQETDSGKGNTLIYIAIACFLGGAGLLAYYFSQQLLVFKPVLDEPKLASKTLSSNAAEMNKNGSVADKPAIMRLESSPEPEFKPPPEAKTKAEPTLDSEPETAPVPPESTPVLETAIESESDREPIAASVPEVDPQPEPDSEIGLEQLEAEPAAQPEPEPIPEPELVEDSTSEAQLNAKVDTDIAIEFDEHLVPHERLIQEEELPIGAQQGEPDFTDEIVIDIEDQMPVDVLEEETKLADEWSGVEVEIDFDDEPKS